MPPRPRVYASRIHPALQVNDLPAALDYYTQKLGFTLGFTFGEPPSFAGVNLDEISMFLQPGTPSPEGCWLAFVVGNADELYEFQRDNGVQVVEPPADREYGLRDYSVRDLDGYVLSFGQYIYNQGPALEIERIDVPVRLEKRLAAVLQDLADYKRMSLSSCLEETLLHTFEPLGDGVASPHTPGQLSHIQELKRKHGIDYDSHGSYRFVEKASDS